MHIPSTRIWKGTIEVYYHCCCGKKNELCKPNSWHYFNNHCLAIQKCKCHNQVYWCFHCGWSTAILRCCQKAYFFNFPHNYEPYRTVLDLKTEIRTDTQRTMWPRQPIRSPRQPVSKPVRPVLASSQLGSSR